MIIRRRTLLAGLAATPVLTRGAEAQIARGTIKLVVGFPPGGSGDVFARITANGLSDQLKQSVIVDNRGGAGGLTAGEYVMRAPTDGSILMLHTGSSAITAPICKKVWPYDPVKDFAWIAHLSTAPFVIAVNPSLPVTDLKSFIAYAKAKNGDLSYGSAGVGTTVHLGTEQFNDLAGFKATHVPYRGSGQAIIDTMSGSVSFMMESIGTMLPYHKAGTLKILVLFSDKRVAIAPEIPTGRELGIDMVSGTSNLLAAPAKTPQSIIQPMAEAMHKMMARKELQDQLNAQGILPVLDSGPEGAKAFVSSEIAKLLPIVKKLDLAT